MSGSEEHIKALRLLNLSQDDGLEVTEQEDTHFLVCEGCRQALAMFALLFGTQRPTLMPDQPLS
jgi:hypothetical protein